MSLVQPRHLLASAVAAVATSSADFPLVVAAVVVAASCTASDWDYIPLELAAVLAEIERRYFASTSVSSFAAAAAAARTWVGWDRCPTAPPSRFLPDHPLDAAEASADHRGL